MRRIVLAVVVVAGVAAILLAVWLRRERAAEKEGRVDTEVAVRVAPVVRATLRAWVTAYGVVEPAPPGARAAAGSRVAPAVAGVVASVRCAEGQRVEKGALLFELDSRAADAAAEKARSAVGFAEKGVERQRSLALADATSQRLLLDAEQALASARGDLAAAEAQQALLHVTAPLSGTVTRVNVRPGEAVDLTTTLAEVADLDRLVATVGVPQAELAALRAGQEVEVAAGAATVRGTVVTVGQEVDARTGAAPVRVGLPPGSGLRPGEFVTVRIVSAVHAGCLAVPTESVVKDGDGNTVIALVENGSAAQKQVKAGIREGDLVEVAGDGVREGAQVVTEGAYGLPRETRVRVLGK